MNVQSYDASTMPARLPPIRVRRYGRSGRPVILLHGGPGAPGYMAPLARALADDHQVIEPLQRGSAQSPHATLTVDRHVADLKRVLDETQVSRPALVGSSWGAMLALCFAAAYNDASSSIVLIGCGTFDRDARSRIGEIVQQRSSPELQSRLQSLPHQIKDPDQRLSAMASLLAPIYSHELVHGELEFEECDARAHHETWNDMVRLQDAGVYPHRFQCITSPVLMMHGDCDPHPGRLIRDSLHPHIPHVRYHELKRCGHYPWLERHAQTEFFSTLRRWLNTHP